MTRGSLRLRLMVAGVISVLGAIVLVAVGLTLLFERHVERRVEAELSTYLDQIAAGLERRPAGELFVETALADPRFAQPLSGLYWQVQTSAGPLRSRSLWDNDLVVPADVLPDGTVHLHRIPGPGDVELFAIERTVTLPARLGGEPVRAVVAVDAAEIAAATRDFATDLLPYLMLLAVVLVAAAYAQVTVGLKPLDEVRTRLAAIRQGKARRLGDDPAAFPQEILPLAAEVDALLEARETQVERARARACDLAHGLKTPLQVLTGDIGRLRQRGEETIAGEIEQVATAMQRHVDRELARSRLMAANGSARARLFEVVERVLSVIVRTPAGAELDWEIKVPEHLMARIDPDDLAEAIGNLLENAAHHARRRVVVEARQMAGSALVCVTDDGPGIPGDQLGNVLARGVRLDQRQNGAGLGLAIVQDIVEAWGGQFEIRSGPAGLEVELRVPA
jgi:signal transduction histidine kinase